MEPQWAYDHWAFDDDVSSNRIVGAMNNVYPLLRKIDAAFTKLATTRTSCLHAIEVVYVLIVGADTDNPYVSHSLLFNKGRGDRATINQLQDRAKSLHFDMLTKKAGSRYAESPFQGFYTTQHKGAALAGPLLVAAVSQQENVGHLLALISRTAMMVEKIKLHHIGFRVKSIHEMLSRVKSLEEITQTKATWPEADDHIRAYVSSSPTTIYPYFIEVQYFPHNPTYGLHWDIVCDHADENIRDFQRCMEEKCMEDGTRSEFFENSPIVGAVWTNATKDSHSMEVGVMLREEDWEIPQVERPNVEEIYRRVNRIIDEPYGKPIGSAT